jgi:hypothetical protein
MRLAAVQLQFHATSCAKPTHNFFQVYGCVFRSPFPVADTQQPLRETSDEERGTAFWQLR